MDVLIVGTDPDETELLIEVIRSVESNARCYFLKPPTALAYLFYEAPPVAVIIEEDWWATPNRELIARIRENQVYNAIKIVACCPPEKEKPPNADFCLSKPFSQKTLHAELFNIFGAIRKNAGDGKFAEGREH